MLTHFRLGGLWRHPDFLKLWMGGTVSRFGSQITFLALPLTAAMVLDATPVQMGILAAAGAVPSLVFGLGAGVWIDRRKKRPIMIAADYGRAILLLAVPVGAVLDILSIYFLYAIALAMGLLSMLFNIANRSMLPSLVARDKLVEANSKLAVGSSASEVAGPGFGGILVQLLTAPIALIADALTFVASALAVQSIRAPEPQPEDSPSRHAFVREALQGLVLIRRSRMLLPVAGVIGGIAIFNAMFEAVWLLYVNRVLGLEPFTFGIMFSMGGFGLMLGALGADRFIGRVGVGRAIVIGVVIVGLSDMATPLIGGPAAVIIVVLTVASFLFSVGATITGVALVSLRQAVTPISLQGRMNGAMNSLETGLVPVGALIGGVLGQTIGMRETLFLATAGEIAAVLWVLFSPVWSQRALPEPSLDS